IVMAARPGRIHRVIDVDLPYPRTEEVRLSPEFAEVRNDIWTSVYHNEVTAPTPRPDLFHRSEWITMNIRRRTLLGGMATLPALGALASCGASGSGDTTEITYGYIPDFNGASLLAIAEDQGLWEENGLTANLQTFTNGPLQIQALGTGD